jgi:hypothetical protein
MERLAATAPGRMESQSALRDRKHPLWTLQHFDPDDLNPTLYDALADEEKRRQARIDAAPFQLQVQFVRAHGLPRGEVTMLLPADGFSSRLDRHR